MICTYKDLTYSLTQTKRKTVSIFVEPQGTITVRAPLTIDINKINNIIDHKSYWIYKSIAEVKELNKTKVNRNLVDGEGYLYLGKSYRLKLENNRKKSLTLKSGFFHLSETESENAKNEFIKFYKTRAKSHITERVGYFKKKVGAEPQTVRIMELGKRWASRSKTGLNFHWKTILAPPKIIDYIVVHELAHTKKPNHSQQFWEIVESILPDYRERKEWLRLNGANLDI